MLCLWGANHGSGIATLRRLWGTISLYIPETIMIKTKLSKINLNIDVTKCFYRKFIFIPILFSLYSCVGTKYQQNIPSSLKTEAFEDRGKVSSSQGAPFLIADSSEDGPLKKEGLLWSSKVSASFDNSKLSESDLLLGYVLDTDHFVDSPKNGQCQILESKDLQIENEKKWRVTFQDKSSLQNKQNLFFILNARTEKPIAVVKLNSSGIANCLLPEIPLRISFGFGSQRQDKMMDLNQNEYEIPFFKKGEIDVRSSLQSNIFPGDVIRIGRSYAGQENIFLEKNLNENKSLPIELESDLISKSNFQSQRMGIDEYLKTSFLVDKKSYSIFLDEGRYTIAVLRKNKLICFQNVILAVDKISKLSCDSFVKKETDLNVFELVDNGNSNTMITNGAEIRLFDYSFMDSQNFSNIFGQKFRLRVSVPAWNSTDIVEMYVNDKLYQRWVLDRGDLSKPYSVNLEQNTVLDDNFKVQFKAWGPSLLPDFFTNRDEKPFAQTRDYCVKVKSDSECNLHE